MRNKIQNFFKTKETCFRNIITKTLILFDVNMLFNRPCIQNIDSTFNRFDYFITLYEYNPIFS